MNETPTFQPRRAWSITALIAILMVINFLDKVVLGLVSVPMMDELQLTPVQFGLIGGSLHWFYAVAAVAGGFLANRVAARWILFGMALLWSAVQLPIFAAQSIWVIIACRVLLGIGEGPATPVATHAVYKWFPDKKRSLPVALVHQGSALGLLAGGLLIPFVTSHWGWRANFVVLAVIGFIWAGLWLLFGAEGNYDERATANETTGTLDKTIPYRRLFTDPTVIGNYLSHFGAYWILAVILTWLPAYLQKGLGYPPADAGKLFALFILITMPIGLLLAWASQRLLAKGISSRLARGVFVGISLLAAGALLTLLPLSLPGPLKFLLLALGAGLTSVVYSIGPAVLGEIAPVRQRGAVLAVAVVFTSISGFLSPLATGALLQRYGTTGGLGYEYAFLLAGAITLVFGVIVALTVNPERTRLRLLR